MPHFRSVLRIWILLFQRFLLVVGGAACLLPGLACAPLRAQEPNVDGHDDHIPDAAAVRTHPWVAFRTTYSLKGTG